MFVALLIAVALPAQALSAAAERVWNAPHIHLDGGGGAMTLRDAAVSPPRVAAGHYPLQRILDIAQGRISVDTQSLGEAEEQRLDAHAESHRSGRPHHHAIDASGVVYAGDDGDDPAAPPERTGKHDHDGFSPAFAATRMALPVPPHDALAVVTPAVRVSHASGPGERPPR
ncbi:MAG: hypothetical protein ABIO38_05995 [Luteimonas sp.]